MLCQHSNLIDMLYGIFPKGVFPTEALRKPSKYISGLLNCSAGHTRPILNGVRGTEVIYQLTFLIFYSEVYKSSGGQV